MSTCICKCVCLTSVVFCLSMVSSEYCVRLMLVFWILRAILLCTKRSPFWVLFVTLPRVMRGRAEMEWCQKETSCLPCSHWLAQVCQIFYCFACLHKLLWYYGIMVLWYYIWGSDLFLNSLFLCSVAHGPGKLVLGDDNICNNSNVCGVVEVSKMIRMVMGHFMNLKRCPQSEKLAFGQARL